MNAGVAVNPATPVSFLQDIIAGIDLVLIMSVNPGFGGQSFIPHSIEKIREVKALITRTNSSAKIEVDGGISLDNAAGIIKAGADILVAGHSIFSAENPKETIERMKHLSR
jgi:ribulose-phosphate 3-epimerase